MAAGTDHAGALRWSGNLTWWGSAFYGQTSVPVLHNPPLVFETITTGGYHTCGTDPGKEPHCWGLDTDGQASPPSTHKFYMMSAGAIHTCGLCQNCFTDASVSCWGAGGYGQIHGYPGGSMQTLSAGFYHTCAIDLNDHMECWGDDLHGPRTA